MRKFDYQYDPVNAVLPGSFLQDELRAADISREQLAKRCGCSLKQINEIIDKGTNIDPSLAIKIERVINFCGVLLTNLEHRYRFDLARQHEVKEAKKYKKWLDSIPINYLVKSGIIEKPTSRADRFTKLLEFFGVGSLQAWNEAFLTPNTDYRHAKSRKSDFVCLATWIRLGQIATKNIVRANKKRD